MGFSYDVYTDRAVNLDRFNPKLGFQWDIANNLRLRAAWFETIKSALPTNQTIEPTQIAGFNQLFDDINGTKSRRMGIGIDTHISNTLFGGIEVSKRSLEIPFQIYSVTGGRRQYKIDSFEHQEENLFRSYLYWTIDKHWVVRSEGQFEQYSRSKFDAPDLEPYRINTLSVPMSVNFFATQGLFSSLIGTYVNQQIERETRSPIYQGSTRFNEGKEGFFLVDVILGFRLPKRRGVLSIEARNLLDQKFLYRSTSFNSVNILGFGNNNDIISINPAVANRFIPDRTIMMRLTLHF